jgi:hemolysin activation/secretion protein
LKGQDQITSHVLTATEQFQVGGIANVRAYPPGEIAGDNGYSGTAELSFPVYGIPKGVRAPWSKAKLYDALRLATFYDYGHTNLRTTSAGESKDRTLRGWGCGLRYDLPENFSIRVDVAWPLDNTPSDGNRTHTWIKVTKEF